MDIVGLYMDIVGISMDRRESVMGYSGSELYSAELDIVGRCTGYSGFVMNKDPSVMDIMDLQLI